MKTSDANGADLTGANLSDSAPEMALPPSDDMRDELEPEPNQLTGEEEEPLISWAEAPAEEYAEWSAAEERRADEEEWPAAQEAVAQEAEEEWTAGMVRPPLEPEEPEWEEEPIGRAAQSPLRELEEAEADDKYGA